MAMRYFGIVTLVLVLAGCNFAAPQAPTAMVLPTFVQMPTDGAIVITTTPDSAAQEPTFTATPEATLTLTETHTATDIMFATNTSLPTATITSTPTLQAIVPTDTPDITPFPDIEEARYADISYQDAFDLLIETPLTIMPVEHVYQIYERGRLRGLRDDFLLSVGDCNSESIWYLESLLDDDPPESINASYYDSEQAQNTINYYSNAFAFKGQSVNSGLNAASVLDPFWASADVCAFGDSPLTCDYALTDSFASLIMFGANDVNVLSTAGYETAIREIIETTLERDVIPILSTFTVRPIEGTTTYVTGVRFNAVLVQLAEEYQIPLVNFWLATRDLADRGILEDNAHLTVPGFNIRNQLTVEMMTQIRTEIMNQERQS